MSENGLSLADDDVESLLQAYDSLCAFPDVPSMLDRMAEARDVAAVIFSNGTQSMASNSVHRSSSGLLSRSSVFHDIVTVESVRQYKPAPAVYAHLAERVGKTLSQMNDIWLISGNPFDIVGGRQVGMNAIWIDRAGHGWVDAAIPPIRPTATVTRLEEILDVIENHQP